MYVTVCTFVGLKTATVEQQKEKEVCRYAKFIESYVFLKLLLTISLATHTQKGISNVSESIFHSHYIIVSVWMRNGVIFSGTRDKVDRFEEGGK